MSEEGGGEKGKRGEKGPPPGDVWFPEKEPSCSVEEEKGEHGLTLGEREETSTARRAPNIRNVRSIICRKGKKVCPASRRGRRRIATPWVGDF